MPHGDFCGLAANGKFSLLKYNAIETLNTQKNLPKKFYAKYSISLKYPTSLNYDYYSILVHSI